MPFDPTKPANDAPLDAAVVRDQLNALKTSIDAVPAGPAGPQGPAGATGAQGTRWCGRRNGRARCVPGAAGSTGAQGPQGVAGAIGAAGATGAAGISIAIGGVFAWMKDLPGVPALGAQFVECNGQSLSDAGSPLNGQTIPDLNTAQRFLRGAAASGATGGADTHDHTGNTSTPADLLQAAYNPDLTLATGSHTHPFTTDASSSLPSFYEVVWVMRVK